MGVAKLQYLGCVWILADKLGFLHSFNILKSKNHPQIKQILTTHCLIFFLTQIKHIILKVTLKSQ